MTRVGSSSPRSIRPSGGRMYRCTWHWPVRRGIERFIQAPAGEFVDQPTVDADDGDDSAAAAGEDRLTQGVRPVGFGSDRLFDPVVELYVGGTVGRFHADRVDALVRAATAGELEQRGPHVRVGIIDGLVAL